MQDECRWVSLSTGAHPQDDLRQLSVITRDDAFDIIHGGPFFGLPALVPPAPMNADRGWPADGCDEAGCDARRQVRYDESEVAERHPEQQSTEGGQY